MKGVETHTFRELPDGQLSYWELPHVMGDTQDQQQISDIESENSYPSAISALFLIFLSTINPLLSPRRGRVFFKHFNFERGFKRGGGGYLI